MNTYEIMKELQRSTLALQTMLSYMQGLIDGYFTAKDGKIYKVVTPQTKTLKHNEKELTFEN